MSPESTAVSNPATKEVSQTSKASGIKRERLAVREVEHFPARHDDRAFERNLELELSIRYHGVTSMERLLHYADVQWQSISLNEAPRNVWFRVLQLAKDQGSYVSCYGLPQRIIQGRPPSQMLFHTMNASRCGYFRSQLSAWCLRQ